MAAPKKYVKINGVMKLNPEYKKWKEQQGGGAPATSVARPFDALLIVSSMDDHEKLNDAMVAQGGKEVPLSESTSATIEMMQEPEISIEAGMVRLFIHDNMDHVVPLSHYDMSLAFL
jgi:hypothetical protein